MYLTILPNKAFAPYNSADSFFPASKIQISSSTATLLRDSPDIDLTTRGEIYIKVRRLKKAKLLSVIIKMVIDLCQKSFSGMPAGHGILGWILLYYNIQILQIINHILITNNYYKILKKIKLLSLKYFYPLISGMDGADLVNLQARTIILLF